jgi:mRNA interferase YafQ
LVYTSRFKKDFKLMTKRGKDAGKLFDVIEKLLKEETLPAKYQDHPLVGKWRSRRDCHIEPDWILIYYVRGDELILERTGSHSDLFK